jgi:hypothetical protein
VGDDETVSVGVDGGLHLILAREYPVERREVRAVGQGDVSPEGAGLDVPVGRSATLPSQRICAPRMSSSVGLNWCCQTTFQAVVLALLVVVLLVLAVSLR